LRQLLVLEKALGKSFALMTLQIASTNANRNTSYPQRAEHLDWQVSKSSGISIKFEQQQKYGQPTDMHFSI